MEDNRLEIINAAVDKDSAFADKLAKCSSAEELQKVLGEIGVELNDEEVKAAYEQMKNPQSEEISEAGLDNVAGGLGVTIAVGIGYLLYKLGRKR